MQLPAVDLGLNDAHEALRHDLHERRKIALVRLGAPEKLVSVAVHRSLDGLVVPRALVVPRTLVEPRALDGLVVPRALGGLVVPHALGGLVVPHALDGLVVDGLVVPRALDGLVVPREFGVSLGPDQLRGGRPAGSLDIVALADISSQE